MIVEVARTFKKEPSGLRMVAPMTGEVFAGADVRRSVTTLLNRIYESRFFEMIAVTFEMKALISIGYPTPIDMMP
jgi:hypothetical protein